MSVSSLDYGLFIFSVWFIFPFYWKASSPCFWNWQGRHQCCPLSNMLTFRLWTLRHVLRLTLPLWLSWYKNLPAMWETWVWSLAWEDPLEKGKATHSSILALRIPWTTVQGVPKSRTRLSDFHFTSLPRYNFSSALFKPAWESTEGWVYSQTYPPRWLAAIWGVLFLFPAML